MKKVLLSLFIVFNFGLVSSQSINEQKAEKYLSLKGEITFTFKVNNKNEIDHYTRDFSIVNYDPKTKTVKAWANENQFRVFKSKNIPFEVPESENEVDANLIYDNKSKSSTKNLTSKSLANTLSFPVDNYPTYAEYAQQMQDFENDYPTLVDKFSIGSTTENDGKELLFVKISDNVSTDEQEPKLMFTSSMHGDEIAGYPMMLSLIDYILTVYSNPGHADHARVKNLVENAEIWINPSANPDGTYYGSAGNTSVTGARRGNFNNLDLNRNYPDNVAGPHDDGNAYQIETLAFMALADANHFVLSANFHGGTELVNYPFDNAYVSQYTHPDGDWFEFTGVEYATHAQNDSDALGDNTYMTADDDSNVYPSPGVTHGAEWYRVYGGRQDFMNFYHQCKEVTIELSDTKILPESQLVNYWLYNRDALLDYLTQGTYGFRGIVKDANTNTPIETTVTLVGHDAYGSHTYSDATKGDYYRPVKAGTYDILFEADCYQSFTLNNQTILDYETKALADVLLTPITSAVPTNLSASSITTDSASISWDSSAGATFDLRYREVGSFNWIEVTGLTSSPYNISLLNTSTNYEVQVRSVCSGSSSAYTSSTIFTTTAVNYCTSTSSNVNDEYISRVQLNSIDNISGAQFYSDFTNISTILTKNSQYTITITPTWPGTVYTEAYSVWIDYNADGDFNDLGEQVFSQSPINSTNVSGSFTIPSNAIENATRMRVSMQYNAIPTACQSFQYGEVEDYTITIEPAGPDTSAPSTPQNLASSNITENTVDLNWTASNDNVGVIAYDIYQDGNIIDSVSGTSYPVIGLTANTAYNFSVIAKDAAGNQSETSNILNISTLAAPSCVDGIQNGTETGVDCGGSSCAPCSNVQLYEGYFENGLDGWTDGGNDCARVASVNSYEGNYSIQLRDNTGVASSMTSPSFNLSGFDSVEFNFFFYANSMENDEDLLLLYNDGSGWEILTSWVSGSTLINNSINNVAFTLDNSFNLSNNAQFRIQCDASGNNDQVYIDQIVITGINSVDTTAPMITLIGPGNIDINLGDAYTELGATATDNKDGDITANIVIGGDAVDTNTTGTYTVTYNVNDAAGNAATQVDRTVNVVPDTTAPVIALVGNATINLNIGDSYTEEGATATDNKDGDITA
ncbi:M14 family zinc carboxypeptidase, partial [Algibacter agarivorans]|uniref:M14 family zinc carboxypeptidase n=1 Tax=Algibacter agarivorans TaxID=1109741 RepID=UPI0031EF8F1D